MPLEGMKIMRKIDTLKKNYEFSNVLKKGEYFVKKHVTVYIEKNKINKNVIGIAVNTKTFGAVRRNHIKRLIREAFYKERENLKKGYNIVFLWNKRESAESARFQTIHKEIAEIFREANIVEKN